MYQERQISGITKKLAGQYPVVTITGPRQSGKTTLARHLFDDREYVNLEHLETREYAATDPVGFLKNLSDGAVIDEIQRVLELLSYIQVIVDEKQKNNMYILTGSQHFALLHTISQSLAGRTALLRLLPFSISETAPFLKTDDWRDYIYRGFYPRIYDQKLNPTQALGDYFETYVERDIRQLSQIQNLTIFQKFVKLCAGRIGQILNLSNLANDAGITHTTAREWIGLLQTSYIVFLLEPFFHNIRKRVIKSPKLYFYDVGLAAYLLGIENKTHLQSHPLQGNLFENLALMEILKFRFNHNKKNNLLFYRDSKGNEVDVLYHISQHVVPVEIKSGQTINSDYFKGFKSFETVVPNLPYGKLLIYGGHQTQKRRDVLITNIWQTAGCLDKMEKSIVT